MQHKGTSMSEERITVEEFRAKLIALCVESTLTGLPRKHHDRQIVLHSVLLALEPATAYREDEINAARRTWLSAADRLHYLDHVTLRGALVDDGYLEQDAAGKVYRVRSAARWRTAFDPAIADLSVSEILKSGAEMVERKKRLHAPSS